MAEINMHVGNFSEFVTKGVQEFRKLIMTNEAQERKRNELGLLNWWNTFVMFLEAQSGLKFSQTDAQNVTLDDETVDNLIFERIAKIAEGLDSKSGDFKSLFRTLAILGFDVAVEDEDESDSKSFTDILKNISDKKEFDEEVEAGPEVEKVVEVEKRVETLVQMKYELAFELNEEQRQQMKSILGRCGRFLKLDKNTLRLNIPEFLYEYARKLK